MCLTKKWRNPRASRYVGLVCIINPTTLLGSFSVGGEGGEIYNSKAFHKTLDKTLCPHFSSGQPGGLVRHPSASLVALVYATIHLPPCANLLKYVKSCNLFNLHSLPRSCVDSLVSVCLCTILNDEEWLSVLINNVEHSTLRRSSLT